MATYHDLLFTMDEITSSARSPPTADDTQPPPVVRSRRLYEKRQPPSEVAPTWAGGERYATDIAEILGTDQ